MQKMSANEESGPTGSLRSSNAVHAERRGQQEAFAPLLLQTRTRSLVVVGMIVLVASAGVVATTLPSTGVGGGRGAVPSSFAGAAVLVALLLGSCWLIPAALLEHSRVRKRQAVDVTSEWARYASDPAARGRAVAWLALQVLPLYVLSKLLSRLQDRRRSHQFFRWSGQILAHGLLKLGPTYVKIGQIASCHGDLLPAEWVTALEKLQDQVPSRQGSQAWELVDASWPGGSTDFRRTFSEFDATPIAAASLGQVHRARLASTGEDVAIKLQRPHLKQIYEHDMALLLQLAAAADHVMGYLTTRAGGASQQRWTDIFREAQVILEREIDYRDEARHISRFCADFGLAKGGRAATVGSSRSKDGAPLPSAAEWIRSPVVYEHLSSERVLVMEYVPSIKITDRKALEAANVTAQDMSYLADMLARSYLRQFCCNLFFSTDPHPGNLGVEVLDASARLPKDRVRLVFYDFGQAATLSDAQAAGILTMMEAIVDTDVNRSIEAFLQMGVLTEGADLDKVRVKVSENYRTGKIKANRKRLKKKGYVFRDSNGHGTPPGHEAATTQSVSDAEIMKYFTLPAEYAFVARALTQMDGVGKFLDSDFDFISSAAPWMFEIKGVAKFLQEEATKRWNRFAKRVNVRGLKPAPARQGALLLFRYESFRAVFKKTRTKLFRRK